MAREDYNDWNARCHHPIGKVINWVNSVMIPRVMMIDLNEKHSIEKVRNQVNLVMIPMVKKVARNYGNE